METVLVVLGIVGFSIVMGLILRPTRQRRAARRRPALGRRQFVEILMREGHAAGIAGAVYDGLENHFALEMTHVYPGDDLVGDHLMDEDDLTAVIREIFGSLGRRFPPPDAILDEVNSHHAHATPRYIAELARKAPPGPRHAGATNAT